MATGASNAQLAVILIDARKGVLTQTRRHSFICSLLGVRHVVVAVNKIDLVDFRRGCVRPHRRRLSGVRVPARLHLDHAGPDLGALWRQRHRPVRQHAVVPRTDPARASRDRRCRERRSAPNRSVSRCSGSTGPTSIFAAMPARSRPDASATAIRRGRRLGRTSRVAGS